MSPRPYRMERRRETTDETRLRIIDAARELLATRDGSVKFSMEEVGRRAGVARMTVYHQFGSLRGLLEGLCDSLAMAGGMSSLADVFQNPDPLGGLDDFIAVFVRFWESDREVRRGLGAFAVLDPEFAAVLEHRSGWRRKGLRVLLDRLAKETGRPKGKQKDQTLDLIYLLTDFHTYDTLADSGRSPARVTRLLQQVAHQLLA